MEQFFNVNSIFFTVVGYPMSYIEFFGTIFNICSVWLVAKNKTLNWPVGILGTILFAVLFLQINLYADFFEQIYFFITGFWGWWVWSSARKIQNIEKPVVKLSGAMRIVWLCLIALATLGLGYITAHLHQYLPKFFTEAASYPFLDAFTTVLSFAATIMLVRKELDAWVLWIIVDIIGIVLYWVKDVHLVSVLYIVFLVLAIKGLLSWLKINKEE